VEQESKQPYVMRGANGKRLLTYDEATPEQVAEARERGRRQLAEGSAKLTPEYWAALWGRLESAPPRGLR
jgi:hypothetical protein